ncbi:MAG: hemolysin family protein [Fimbriimonadaceae bacterium]|nr:hemolysin family protein [Fimbriimonadaceae bacterium]
MILPLGTTLQALSSATRNSSVFSPDVATLPLLVLGLAAIYLLSALFVAGEVALEELRSIHFRTVDDKRGEAHLREAFDRKQWYIAACVLGNETMKAWIIILCFLLSPSLAQVLTPQEESLITLFLAGVVLTIPLVAVNVIASELVAKSYAILHPARVVLRLYGFIRFFATLFAIPSLIATKIAGLFTRRFGADASFAAGNQAEEEIKGLVSSYEETGDIEEDEKEMLHSVFEFNDTVAREVMTPRVDMESVRVETSLLDVANLVEQTGHSRFPVFEISDDQIVGIIHAKDILRTMAKGESHLALSDLMRPAYFVPETKDLHDLLQDMRQLKTQMVIVQDEFGGTAGLVTIEDIVEELVGEIVDEYDNESPSVVEEGDSHVVDGRLHLDDLNAAIGTSFESDEFDTIGGYVFGLFGRQPNLGDSIEEEGFRFTIVQTDGRRIETVRIERPEEVTFLDELLGEPVG